MSDLIFASPGQGIYQESSTPVHTLGTLYAPEGFGGRLFRYAKNGAVALAAGKLVQSTAPDSNLDNETVAASAVIGATKITIDAGGAVTANTYDDGVFYVNDATGEGLLYRIERHETMASAGEMDVYLSQQTPLKVAVTVDVSEVTLLKNPWNGVIVTPTTALTGKVVGLSPIAVTASYYFWAQVRGPAAVLINGTISTFSTIVASLTVAGAVDELATGTIAQPIVGQNMEAGTDTEYGGVWLNIE